MAKSKRPQSKTMAELRSGKATIQTVPKLTGDAAKPGVGLHRKLNPVEILIYRKSVPQLRANAMVRSMSDEEKSFMVEHCDSKDPETVAKFEAIVSKADGVVRSGNPKITQIGK